MAKLNRYDVKIFAGNASNTEVTAFKTAGSATPTYSKQPDEIQNTAYGDGWIDQSNVTPYAEDLNGVMYSQTYLLKYLYEMGIAEWSSTATYYINSYCQTGGSLYRSKTDNNVGHNPTSDTTNWQMIDTTPVTASNLGTAYGVYKEKVASDLKFKGITVSGNGSISATDDTITIAIGGGETGTVYWQNLPKSADDATTIGTELGRKQNTLTYTPEDVTNKTTDVRDSTLANNTKYPTELATRSAIDLSVGNLANSLSTVATSGSYEDLSDTPTIPTATSQLTNDSGFVTSSSIPTVNDATLTIQKNGTTIDTFTANSSTNKTVNVTVPTNTNELTNGAGFITSSALPTKTSDLSNDSGFITNSVNGGFSATGSITAGDQLLCGSHIITRVTEDKFIGYSYNNNLRGVWYRTSGNTLDIGDSADAVQIRTKLNISYGYQCRSGTSGSSTNDYFNIGAGKHLYIGNNDQGTIQTSSSDSRIKTNVKDMEYGLEEVLQLRPVTFNKYDEPTRGGFIAQEVLSVVPEAIEVPENPEKELYGIDMFTLIAMQAKAIQELNEKVESLEARIEALEG